MSPVSDNVFYFDNHDANALTANRAIGGQGNAHSHLLLEDSVFKTSELLLLNYPTQTILQTDWTYRPRRLEVIHVRDLIRSPLTPEEFLRRPLIHRGRWLVKARDLDSNQVKQFYLASSKEYYRATGLRMALYWPGETNERYAEVLPRRFAATKRDRIILALSLIKLKSTDFSGFDLRVTVDRRTS
jgi:hypothetical protein